MNTEEIIANQLAENTGTHFMDSGMARGRAWQRNQDRAAALDLTVPEMFEAGPDVWWGGYGVTLSTYHWMVNHVTHHPGMQARFDRWVNLGWVGLDRYADGPFTNSPSTVDAWLDKMLAHGWIEEHPEFDGWTNTYNHDNSLSQDLQFRLFATTDDHPLGALELVALSTHNGADARGGYSDFKIYECDSYDMFDWDAFSAWCPQCEVRPRDPESLLFDETPYLQESSGLWWHRSGDWDADFEIARGLEPIFDPRYPGYGKPAIDLPDDFEQTGPICPIHLCNMEVSA